MEPSTETARCPWCSAPLPDPNVVNCPSCHAALALGPLEAADSPHTTPPPNPFGPRTTGGTGAAGTEKPAEAEKSPFGAAAEPSAAPFEPGAFGPPPTEDAPASPFGSPPMEDVPASPFGSPVREDAPVSPFGSPSPEEPAGEWNPGAGFETPPPSFGPESVTPASSPRDTKSESPDFSSGSGHTPFGDEPAFPPLSGHGDSGDEIAPAPGLSPFGGEPEAAPPVIPAPFGMGSEPSAPPALSPFGEEPRPESTPPDLHTTEASEGPFSFGPPSADEGEPPAGHEGPPGIGLLGDLGKEPEGPMAAGPPAAIDTSSSPFAFDEPESGFGPHSQVVDDAPAAPLFPSPFGTAAEAEPAPLPPTLEPVPTPVSTQESPVASVVDFPAEAPPMEPIIESAHPADNIGDGLPPIETAPAAAADTVPVEVSPVLPADLPIPHTASEEAAPASAPAGAPPAGPFDLTPMPAGPAGMEPAAGTAAGSPFDFDFAPAAALPVMGDALSAGAFPSPTTPPAPPPSTGASFPPIAPFPPVAPSAAAGADSAKGAKKGGQKVPSVPGAPKSSSKLVVPLIALGLALLALGGGAYWWFSNHGAGMDTTAVNGSAGYPPGSAAGYPPGSTKGGGTSSGRTGATGGGTALAQRPGVGGPEGAGHTVQVYWRSATADYLKQHPRVNQPGLKNATGSSAAVLRVDVENYGSKAVTVRPQSFRLKVGSATISPASQRLPDLLRTIVLPPKEAVRGWLFFNSQGIPSSLGYSGKLDVNVSPSQFPNGPQ